MSVTVEELKLNLRITNSDEDAELADYLASAVDYLESISGLKLTAETRTAYFDVFGDMELIGNNPTSIVVSYVDTNGDSQTLSSSVYALKTHKIRPYLTLAYGQSYPSVRAQDAAVSVAYTSGYNSSTIPASLKQAILLEASNYYEFRESQMVVNVYDTKTINRLIGSKRVYTL